MLTVISVYALWRMRQRPTPSEVDEQVSFAAVLPTASPVAVEAAQEYYLDNVDDEEQMGRITETPT